MSASHNLRTSYLFLLISFGAMAANASIQKIFKKGKEVPLLRFADIISTHYVHSEMDCAFHCGKEPTCVGFKYKHGVNSPSVNCQLSNSTGENDMADDDDQGWVFFVDIKSKLARTQAPPTAPPQHEGCSGYKWLNESNRNKKYSENETYCDDGLTTGWYRFGGEAGNKMLTSCVPWNRCGTDGAGWMNGTHPTVADGKVTRKVCYNYRLTSTGNCCDWSNNIEVVNCGQYYVYKLSKPPTCNFRYCGSDD